MRVAIFTDTFSPQINGVTNTLTKMLTYFEQTGIDYRVFAPKYDSFHTHPKSEQFFSLKLFFYPDCRMAIPNAYRIDHTLKLFEPDIIHVMTEFNMGVIGLRYAKKHGIPCIASYTTNFSQYTDYFGLNVFKPAAWNYMKWFHDQADLTVCPSLETQKLLKRNGIVRTEIFSRGIDCKQFNRKHRSEKLRNDLGISGKTTFLYVGRISVEKDLDILGKAYHTMKRNHGDKIAMVITGDGPYMDKCRDLFPNDTIFTGFQTGDALAKMYASCDIFVCPSASETFGNVVLEAMASGTAVIGADAGGVREIIHHTETGLKFKGQDSPALTDCMDRLLQNLPLRQQIAANGVQYAKNQTWNNILSNLIRYYQLLIVNRKSASA